MRRILYILGTLIFVAGCYLFVQKFVIKHESLPNPIKEKSLSNMELNQNEKNLLPLMKGSIYELVGEDVQVLIDHYGDPDRKDMSAYGYNWWVYTTIKGQYVQFGIDNNKIVTVFATGAELNSEPLQIGEKYDVINDTLSFEESITYKEGISFYEFILNEDDLQTVPLVKLEDDLFVQCYFDTFENELSAIRILTGEVLLRQRSYEMEYRGQLPDPVDYEEDVWEKIEEGMEKQIFDLTNFYRARFDVPQVKEAPSAQQVAYLHSRDMEENNYFSHTSKDGRGLKERLDKEKIFYASAGENIAALHVDGPAAVEGWMNSEGHREALLNKEYTHLGVGVYHLYYTQNFIFKP